MTTTITKENDSPFHPLNVTAPQDSLLVLLTRPSGLVIIPILTASTATYVVTPNSLS